METSADAFAFASPYDPGVRTLAPVEVITILAERLEKRADALEGVRMPAYSITIDELRRLAAMARKAEGYLRTQAGRSSP